jgi:hypothetical protein
MNEYKWRLYGKHGNEKQFKPIDWKNGVQVGNLIYASIFSDAEKEKIEKIDIPANPEWRFEFRKI